MPSRGKKKTTMAKLNRESRLRERKAEKEARKNARRHAAMFGPPDEVGGDQAPEFDGLEPGGPDSNGLEPSGAEPGVAESLPTTDG